jgi:uncharacterized protein (DUF697 family)
MEQFFLPVLIALTSAGACFVGVKAAGLPGRILRVALGKALECIGLALVFLAVNVAAGVIAALAARYLLSTFVSLYPMADASLLGLSLLQALTFQWWQELSKRSSENGVRNN